jgi:hypothetical protein
MSLHGVLRQGIKYGNIYAGSIVWPALIPLKEVNSMIDNGGN